MSGSWTTIFHTLVIGTLAYVVLIILLRISGKRTLSKWNAFDFIVTIAFGSILGMILLAEDTSLIQGTVGFGLLVLLQLGVSWLSVNSKQMQALIKAKPALLLYQGKMIPETLKKERITEEDVLAAIRAKGISAIENVEAVVLETNGNFSVIEQNKGTSSSALIDVEGYPVVQRELTQV
ncbi:MAG: YetF domain-containing protein [Lyngbya sp.]|nr:YetF domain-containing protein [Lyngbya sp.]